MIYGYCRISTSHQQICNQTHEIQAFADKNNLKIDKWLDEVISSRKSLNERKLGKLLKKLKKGDILATIEGPGKYLLLGERVALNYVQRMSGIATETNKYQQAIGDLPCKIVDTRKTTPLLRLFERQAVRDGGGTNHRYNLSDRVLIKDNHIAAVGSITEAVALAKKKVEEGILIEVEVETKEEFLEALDTECDIIMLDNMNNELMGELVEINNGKKKLEASGNMMLKRVRSVALLGVDFISVGALTHSYKSLDISLKFYKGI